MDNLKLRRLHPRLLILNRGEIAIRIAKAARELGIHTIGVRAEADSNCLHVFHVDECVTLAVKDPVAGFLDVAAVIELAKANRADSLHPGYGFLSENAQLAQVCADSGICFVGPKPEHLTLFGSKTRSKELAQSCGVPTLEGSGVVRSLHEAEAFVKRCGLPVIIKAVFGGTQASSESLRL